MGVNYTTPLQFSYILNDGPAWSYLSFCAMEGTGTTFLLELASRDILHDNTLEIANYLPNSPPTKVYM